MSGLNPLKFISAFIVEVGGIGLLIVCLPLVEWPGATKPASAQTIVAAAPEWTSYYRAPPTTNLLRSEASAMLGRPRILAAQLRQPLSVEKPSLPNDLRPSDRVPRDLVPVESLAVAAPDDRTRQQYVARTLDAASDKLVGAVGNYLHRAVDETLAQPRVITAQPRRMW